MFLKSYGIRSGGVPGTGTSICKLHAGDYKAEVFKKLQVSILSVENRGRGPGSGLEWQTEGPNLYSECDESHG